MRVRRFEVADAGACRDVINACVPLMDGLNEPARAFILGKNTPEAIAAELGAGFALVVEEAGRLEGVGVLDGDEIRRVYVHPRAQRRGIGARLVRELEAEARRCGRNRLDLSASPSSVGFYEALGFRRGEELTTRNGEAEFVHVAMARLMEPIRLRACREEDRELVFRVLVASLGEYVAATWGWDEAVQREAFDRKFRPERQEVVTFDGVDAGILGIEDRPDHVFVGTIQLLPVFQRRGIGTALMRRVCERAAAKRQPVRLRVLHPNPARRLYERLGFVAVGQTATHIEMSRPPSGAR
jgi:ribosomal protein S18 acetylase RimI-like enzyme